MTNNLPAKIEDEQPTRGQRALVAGAPILPLIPTSYAGVANLANVIFESGLAPRDLDSPQKCAVVIFHGLEIGLPPMMALQRIAVINGRPAIWGDGALALVYAKPDLCEFVEESFEGEGDALKAVCKTKRRGKPVVVRSFSVAQAKRARLWDERPTYHKRYKNKAGEWEESKYDTPNDSPWYRFPERMLQMRARGIALRDTYPDVLMGLYLREELDDGHQEVEPRQEELPPNPMKEEVQNGTAADPGGVGTAPQGDSQEPRRVDEPDGANVPADSAWQPGGDVSVAAETGAVVDATAEVVEETAAAGNPVDQLPGFDDPDAVAAEWIENFNTLEDEQSIKDYVTDVQMWEHLELSHFSRSAAARIEAALNKAMERATADETPPDPNA